MSKIRIVDLNKEDELMFEEQFDVIAQTMADIVKAIKILTPLVEEYYNKAVEDYEEVKAVEKSLLVIERRKGLIRGALGGELHFYSKEFRKGTDYVV